MKSVEERRIEYEKNLLNNELFRQLEDKFEETLRSGKSFICVDTSVLTLDQITVFNGIIDLYKSKGFKTSSPSPTNIIISIY